MAYPQRHNSSGGATSTNNNKTRLQTLLSPATWRVNRVMSLERRRNIPFGAGLSDWSGFYYFCSETTNSGIDSCFFLSRFFSLY